MQDRRLSHQAYDKGTIALGDRTGAQMTSTAAVDIRHAAITQTVLSLLNRYCMRELSHACCASRRAGDVQRSDTVVLPPFVLRTLKEKPWPEEQLGAGRRGKGFAVDKIWGPGPES